MKLLTTKLFAMLAFLAAAFALPATSSAQTTLAVGDISIIGFNANAPDNLTFVAWVPIADGTYIKFTDCGFLSASASTAANNFRGGENFVIWRNNTGTTIAAGTVIKIEGLTTSLGVCTAGSASGLSGISNSGDQIFAYQGAATTGAAPDAGATNPSTFTGTALFGINYPAAFITTGTASSNTSYLPSDLNVTNGNITIVTASVTSAQYTGSRTSQSTFAAYRTAANNPANWTTLTGTGLTTLDTTAFTLSGPMPTITGAATAMAFTTTYGTASAAQSFPVSGSNLTADITATAPTGFEVSNDGISFGATATLTQSGGSASGNIHIRLKADASVTGSYNGVNVALTSTGATTVNITTAASGNAVTEAALTMTGVSASNKVYDGLTAATLSGTPVYVGLQNGESFPVSGTPVANFASANIGTGIAVMVSGYTAPTTNYTVSQPAGLMADITVAPLTVEANDVIKPQGTTLTGGTGYTNFTSTGLVNGETVGSVTVVYGAGAAAGDPAGPYPNSITISDATGGTFTATNYAISYAPGDITVSASPTINTTGTLTAVDTTYGSPSATPTSFSVSGAFLTNDITVTAPANYEVSTTIDAGYAGFVVLPHTGGTVSATTIYVRLAATAPVTGSPHGGNVACTSSGATTVNVATAPSSVAAKNLTIAGLSGVNKEYDRTNAATLAGTASLVGIVGADDVSLAGSPAATFADALVGTAKAVTVTGYTLAGSAASNYSLTQPAGITADITVLALTVSGAAVTTKTYDGTTAATLTGMLVGVIAPDVVTLVGTGTFDNAGPGTAIPVTSTSTLAGADAGNYSLTQPMGLTGDITASTNANLSKLTVNAGALAPVFAVANVSGATSFLKVVENTTTDITVTPTTANTFATVTVNGNSVASGSPSAAISLSEGINTINVVATAQDLTTTKAYTIKVVRQPAATLAAGAIAFTGFNADGNDDLAFAALAPIPQNSVIFFTDEEWNGTNWANYTECMYIWVASSNISAGTIVTLNQLDGVFAGTATSNLGTLIGFGDANNNAGMGASDESIFAFQGTGAVAATVAVDAITDGNLLAAPTTFLGLIANEDTAGAGYSIAGTGLSEAAGTAIIFVNDEDGMRYKGARSGQAALADYLPLIANKATNWDTEASDGTLFLPFNTTPFIVGSPGEVSIAGAAVTEGNSGTVTLSLPVTRTSTATAFTVDYAVTGGTATSGTDYVPLANGTLTFTDGGSASQNIDITVNGDTDIEANETITITLSNVVNTTGLTVLTTASASGTINTDDNIAVTYPPTNALTSTVKGFITLAGAEIAAFDPASKRAFATSNAGLQVVDLTNPAAPALITNIAPASLGVVGLTSNDVSSVALRKAAGANPAVLAASVISSPKTSPGFVIFLNPADGSVLGSVQVGANPDHVSFTPDGTKLLVANEGELDGTAVDVTLDATLGTVSIIDVSGGFVAPPVSTADFTAFDTQVAALRAAGVRIFKNSGGADAVPSRDFEPEYIAISPDGTTAMLTLQEANAVAILDIATATFTSVVPMGQKDYSTIRTDLSDRDNGGTAQLVNPVLGNPVFGLYMPDAIGSYSVGGQTYFVTANEGDDRNDFLNPDESTTVANAGYDLDDTIFPNELDLKTNAKLGRLVVSNALGLRGDTDGDGDIDQILSYGARSFSILDAAGNIVFDSGDMIEMIVASQHPANFDDGRSDNKGPEPEGITVATIGARTYAFVALERSGMVLAFDVTNPAAVTYTTAFMRAGDQNPEGLLVVPASDSPTGKPLLLSSNESSATLTIFEIDQSVDYTLQLLHLADGEAGLLAPTTAPNLAALVDAFDDDYTNTLILAGGDNWLPGPFLAAGTDHSVRDELNATTGSTISLATTTNHPIAAVDIAIQNLIGVEVSAIGNHEFDLGSRVFRDSFTPGSGWVGANFPHVSANLDFSADLELPSRFTNTLDGGTGTLIPEASTLKGRIAPSVVVTKGGEKIGIVGATTQILESISSPSGTEVKGFPTGAGPNGEMDDMALLATQLQPVINELIAEGVDKIVLMAHLQVIANEQALAPLLSGVDVILAAGSNTRLGDANDVPTAFPGHAANFADNYPILTSGADGKPTVIVNTDNEYTYLGRLVLEFDADGHIIVPNLSTLSTVNGAYAATADNVAAAWGVTVGDLPTTAFADGTKGEKVADLTDAVQAVVTAKDGNIAGFSDVYLQGERIAVRNEETNLGNLSADANVAALVEALGSAAPTTFVAALKNGGGIRAQIGTISPPDPMTGEVTYLPPAANPSAGKPAGAVSQLDIENSLRFNNLLMAFDTTPAGLKAILEHGVAVLPNQGRFPQIGGVRFSYDPGLAANSRVQNVVLINEADEIVARVIDNGAVHGSAPASITLITLNFLANGGDSYPMKANGENFRFLLNDGTLSAPLSESLDFTAAVNIPANAVGEQVVLFDYFASRYATQPNAYAIADTPATLDTRIQNINVRTDTVQDGPIFTPSSFRFASASYSVNESGSFVALEIIRDGSTSSAATVEVSTMNGTATAGLDYMALSNEAVNFSIGQTSQMVNVPIADLAGPQGSRSFMARIVSVPAGTSITGATTTVTITEGAGVVSFTSLTQTANPVNAFGLPNTIQVGLVRTDASGGSVSVDVSKTGGTILPGELSFTSPTTVTFGDGETMKFVSIQLNAIPPSASRTIDLGLSNAIGATLGTLASTTITISKKDTTAPLLTVTFGTPNPAGLVNVSGAAVDGGTVFTGINRVELTVANISDPGTPIALSLTGNNFNHDVQLQHGSNKITVTAFDNSGNKSSKSTTLKFTNPAVTALAGTYSGLMLPSVTPSNDNVGLFVVTVNSAGAASGKLSIGGINAGFAGALDNAGTVRFKPTNSTSFDVIDKTEFESYLGALSVSIAGTQATGTLKTSASGSALASASAAKQATTADAGLLNSGAVQKYTVAFPSKPQGSMASTEFPQGDGYASVTVTPNASVSVTGVLADGTVYSTSGKLHLVSGATQSVSLHKSLYRKDGAFAMELVFDLSTTTNAGSDVLGTDSVWLRPARTRARYYKAGWPAGITIDALGARFTVPGSASVLPNLGATSPNAQLQFADGGITGLLTLNGNISATNAFTNTSADAALKLSITKSTGVFTGTFTHPNTTKLGYKGIILQEGANARGFGFFLLPPALTAGASGEGGGVTLSPSGL